MKKFVQEFKSITPDELIDKTPQGLLNETLKSIEWNIVSACNRDCEFCPQSMGFTRTDLMSIETAKIIADRIHESGYKNQMTICGFGEPFLHKKLIDILRIIRKKNDNKIIIITNGDLIQTHHIEALLELNVTIRISQYDERIVCQEVLDQFPDFTYSIRDYYNHLDLSMFNNRSWKDNGIHKPCLIPSYKMMIEYNGDIRPCTHNWASPPLNHSLVASSLSDIWLNQMMDFRLRVAKDRCNDSYCNKCNVNGLLHGENELEILKELHNDPNIIVKL